ncbi:(2Fe-2S)-binding protein [Pseudomonadales bacterium]|nr:(2Fe-2S)-binding protein [Pseudomonadales bacterium]
MFVCICNAVSDQQIADAVKAGARDIEDVQEILMVSTACGTCRQTAEAVIANTLLETAAGRSGPMHANDIANLVYAA